MVLYIRWVSLRVGSKMDPGFDLHRPVRGIPRVPMVFHPHNYSPIWCMSYPVPVDSCTTSPNWGMTLTILSLVHSHHWMMRMVLGNRILPKMLVVHPFLLMSFVHWSLRSGASVGWSWWLLWHQLSLRYFQISCCVILWRSHQ